MINKIDVLKDFIVYVFFDIEELCYGLELITFFYKKDNVDDIFQLIKAKKFDEVLDEWIDLDFLNNVNFNDLPNKLTLLLSNKEQVDLIYYLNSTFTEGYPDEDYFGGNYNLELTIGQLIQKYNEFYRLKIINPNQYISYFIQYFDKIEKKINNDLKKIVLDINGYSKSKDLLDFDLQSEYLDSKRDFFKKELFKVIDKNIFQIKGFADDNGLYFNIEKTLEDYLKYLKLQDFDYSSDFNINNDFDSCYKYLTLKFLDFKLFNKNAFKEIETIEKKELFEEFEKIINENKNVVAFLNRKKFNEIQIRTIFNVLYLGKFNELDLRNIKLNHVEYFRFYYLIHLFDFYEAENYDLITQKTYKKMLGFEFNNNLNQVIKYYKYILGVNNKDNPFNKLEETKEKIMDNLSINMDLLKK